MRSLSKSKLIAFRQCPKRLWLEIHRPEASETSQATEARFRAGHQVGEVARRLYDPENRGILIDAQIDGYPAALKRSTALLGINQPLFEAGFEAAGALAFADVMLPVRRRGGQTWKIVEVKSSGSVKDYHRDDASIQAFIARTAGVRLSTISIATIDTSWVYPGGDDYVGLLKEEDVTEEASSREDEVKDWIKQAATVVAQRKEPKRSTGRHCNEPFACGFASYCQGQEPQPKHSADVIPRPSSRLREHLETEKILELKDVPKDLLSPLGLRVKKHTLSNRTYFDARGAAKALAEHKLPAVFLDFETVAPAVPMWAGTRPYQQIPFQFSAHLLDSNGRLSHQEFLDLSGADPSRPFAKALIDVCTRPGPIFVYNIGFERARIGDLANRYRAHRRALREISERLVDLLPIAREHYYHPSQKGSWSIKAVLPAVVPDLSYEDLEGIADGGMAAEAYLEAIDPRTSAERRDEIRRQLSTYCQLDSYAMMRLWQVFAGRMALKIRAVRKRVDLSVVVTERQVNRNSQ